MYDIYDNVGFLLILLLAFWFGMVIKLCRGWMLRDSGFLDMLCLLGLGSCMRFVRIKQ